MCADLLFAWKISIQSGLEQQNTQDSESSTIFGHWFKAVNVPSVFQSVLFCGDCKTANEISKWFWRHGPRTFRPPITNRCSSHTIIRFSGDRKSIISATDRCKACFRWYLTSHRMAITDTVRHQQPHLPTKRASIMPISQRLPMTKHKWMSKWTFKWCCSHRRSRSTKWWRVPLRDANDAKNSCTTIKQLRWNAAATKQLTPKSVKVCYCTTYTCMQ